MAQKVAEASGLTADVKINRGYPAFSTAAPSFFWFLNASPYADQRGAPNHSPLFVVDEKYLKVGVKELYHPPAPNHFRRKPR